MANTVTTHAFPTIWLSRAVEAVLVLTLAWLVAAWLTGNPSVGMDEASRPGGLTVDAALHRPDVNDMAAIPLFGKQVVEPAAPAAPVRPVAAAPSRLNIRLLGTIVAGDRSSAVMKLGSAKEQVVFTGHDIQPGVTLEEVETDAIVVDNRGRREKVLMAKGSLGRTSGFTAPLTSTPAMPAGGTRSFTRVEIQKQMQDLPNLLTGALAVPHQMNGNPDGFLIQNIVPGSLYEKAGLINGDVIHSVNDKPVTTPEQGIALFQALQEAKSIDLEITRAGDEQRLHFDIQ